MSVIRHGFRGDQVSEHSSSNQMGRSGMEVVSKDTISKCFRKAGILYRSSMVATRQYEDQDPFDELDFVQSTSDDQDQSAQSELEDLIHQLGMPA